MIKSRVCLPENVGCIPSAVVIMTTAEEMQSAFSGRHRKLFFISDLHRSLPTSHGNCRSALYPCYVKTGNADVMWRAVWDVKQHWVIAYPSLYLKSNISILYLKFNISIMCYLVGFLEPQSWINPYCMGDGLILCKQVGYGPAAE